jgi:aspartate-semialdehyde dehydrogenase
MSTSREPRVAVVGATGAVGNQIVELIAARAFAHSTLKLFASSAGSSGTLDAGDEHYLIERLDDPADLAEFDIVFLAVPEAPALEIITARPGPILIDLSACSRAPIDVTVSPGVTPRERVAALGGRKLYAVPNPIAHAIALCLGAIGPVAGAVAVAMQGASAGGRGMIARTVDQATDLLAARLDLEEDDIQRAFNAFARENERALAERIAEQALAMLSRPAARVSVQLAAISILHGTILTLHAREAAEGWIEALRAAPGILLVEESEPLSVIDAVGQEAILARAEEHQSGAEIMCAFDNTRIAALCALWIAETFALKSPVGN